MATPTATTRASSPDSTNSRATARAGSPTDTLSPPPRRFYEGDWDLTPIRHERSATVTATSENGELTPRAPSSFPTNDELISLGIKPKTKTKSKKAEKKQRKAARAKDVAVEDARKVWDRIKRVRKGRHNRK
jgi:hypothetical protein